jgi:hypothetical protein
VVEYEIRCPTCHNPTKLTKEQGVSVLKVNEPLKEAIERYLRGKSSQFSVSPNS